MRIKKVKWNWTSANLLWGHLYCKTVFKKSITFVWLTSKQRQNKIFICFHGGLFWIVGDLQCHRYRNTLQFQDFRILLWHSVPECQYSGKRCESKHSACSSSLAPKMLHSQFRSFCDTDNPEWMSKCRFAYTQPKTYNKWLWLQVRIQKTKTSGW